MPIDYGGCKTSGKCLLSTDRNGVKKMKNIGIKVWNIIETIVRAVFGVVFRIFKIDFSEEQWDSLLQFVKFGLVGVWNTVFNYALYAVSLLIFQRLNLLQQNPYNLDMHISTVIAFIISVFVSFLLNSRFVFQADEGQTRSFGKALLKCYLSYGFTGLILNPILNTVWVRILPLPQDTAKLIAPAFSLIIAIPINFIMNKLWAFKTENETE